MAKSANVKDKDDIKAGGKTGEPWLNEIDQALKREDTWRKRAAEVVKRYKDERVSNDTQSKINILWSNTEVLKSALYSKQAKPDVRRRFPDANKGNQASRYAAEAIERGLIYCADVYDVDAPIEAAIEDVLLPGRGQCRVDYEPSIVGDGDDAYVGQQQLKLVYSYWGDFTHGLARQWCDVPWVAFRHAMRKGEFETKFPDKKRNPKAADYEMKDVSGTAIETSENDKFIEVWEVWNKPTKQRLYVARGYFEVLQSDDDPLQLSGFFPCPEPLYSVTTNDKLIPEPEYCQYQDLARELDIVSTRIRVLTEFLQWKGIYDGSVDGENMLANLAGAPDGDFMPYKNWSHLLEKGGIDKAVGFWPMERIVPVLENLNLRQASIVQKIYEVTGISDIIRGATDPRETKGAQQLKAQFGSMRMQRRQRDVQRFIRDLYRLKAEIIAEHFTPENLAEITQFGLPTRAEQAELKMKLQMESAAGSPQPPAMVPSTMANGAAPPPAPPNNVIPMPGMQSPPAQPQPQMGSAPAPKGIMAKLNGPTWDDVIEILRSDKLRGYRVDIETDSTILQDAEAEKAARSEFMVAFNDMLEKAYLAAVNAPQMLPLIKESILFGVRTFKAGRAMEQAVEDAFDELTDNPPAPPPGKEAKAPTGPDPRVEMAKLDIDKQKVQNDADAKKADLDIKKQQAEHSIDLEERKFKLSIAAQNKQIFDEAQEQLNEAMTPPADGAAPAPQGTLPLQLMMQSIEKLAQSIAQGQAQQGAQIAQLTQAVAAPKRVVRGPDNRVVGVEPIVLQ